MALSTPLVGWLSIAVGAFSAAGAVMEWPFFMGDWRVRVISRFLGRNGARAFYVLLGTGLAALGIVMLASR